ncbi:hypothetical protein F4810DRAFT_710414 [Camillea tinctor]|nr:hypothetical protein F4810DRAFT_710414 [Camillea tinctor]
MELSTEAIVAIVALLITCPPSFALIWSWIIRRNIRRNNQTISLSGSPELLGLDNMLPHTAMAYHLPRSPYLRTIQSSNVMLDVETGMPSADRRRGTFSSFNLTIKEDGLEVRTRLLTLLISSADLISILDITLDNSING